jgi:hypothetical protein
MNNTNEPDVHTLVVTKLSQGFEFLTYKIFHTGTQCVGTFMIYFCTKFRMHIGTFHYFTVIKLKAKKYSRDCHAVILKSTKNYLKKLAYFSTV